MSQNLVTCIYQTHLCNASAYLTLTWSKSLFSHSLTIHASDSFSLTISLLPIFPIFKSRPGSKTVHSGDCHKFKIYWDFSKAKFPRSDYAEPDSGYYIAIVCNSKLEFFIGDKAELTRRVGLTWVPDSAESGTLLSRREHVFGHKSYKTQAEFMGSKHEIGIECKGGVLVVKVNGEISLVVKRLAWKFRGSERIILGGMEVEFFWDVFNWVCNSHNNFGKGKTRHGHGVFGFQIGDGSMIWPELVDAEKKLIRKSLSLGVGSKASVKASTLSPAQTCSSVMQWAEESSSECGRSSCSSSTKSCGSGGGFSLLLYAWRKE